MEIRQNTAQPATPTDTNQENTADKPLTIQQQLWIDYNALSGLITDLAEPVRDDKTGQMVTMRKVSISEFARMINVDRDTLRRWRNSIPDFWGKVNDRRRELAPQSRLQRVHETWYLKAVAGDFQFTQLWLANFDPNFRMPSQPVQLEAGDSWVELLKKADPKLIGGPDGNEQQS